MARVFTLRELEIIRQAMRCDLRRANMITAGGTVVGTLIGVACIVVGVTLSHDAYVGGGVALVITWPVLMAARTVNTVLFGIIQKMVRTLEEAGVDLASCLNEQAPIDG